MYSLVLTEGSRPSEPNHIFTTSGIRTSTGTWLPGTLVPIDSLTIHGIYVRAGQKVLNVAVLGYILAGKGLIY